MKNLIILYAGEAGKYAKENILGQNAISRSLQWAKQISNVCAIKTIENKQTLKDVFDYMLKNALEYEADTIIFAHSECPFYSTTITEELLQTQLKYAAEYTFADGFPYGIAPEVLNIGTVKILNTLIKDKADFCTNPISKNSIFELMQTDINSFEIETVLSKKDYRSFRIDFSCDTKRNFLLCKQLVQKLVQNETQSMQNTFDAANFNMYTLCDEAINTASVLRTLPAYYEVQIVKGVKNPTIYDTPNMQYEPNNRMSFEKLAILIDKIADFSDDAVISLSLFGDPLLHPDFVKIVKKVLSYKSLSLLIETDGIEITENLINEITQIIKESGNRNFNMEPINWIIRLDSIKVETYGKIRNISDIAMANILYQKAMRTVLLLKQSFKNVVYPQFVRMTDNEMEMEEFYRYWDKQFDEKFIIQKYDNCTGLLKDRTVANLEPLKRTPCWHLCRDMCILIDGTVPVCKEAVFAKQVGKQQFPDCGNAFTDSMHQIFAKGMQAFQSHLDGKYSSQCKACDEYYTYNF
ncbi:MAG: hypothetical protein BKP49_09210 [Treponema sp. CETP13]|nr:MAG: hypothetical protein BKP49_09210 [Treponema sp. CETP13]